MPLLVSVRSPQGGEGVGAEHLAVEHLHRLVGEVQSRHLEGLRGLFRPPQLGHPGLPAGFHPLFQLLSGEGFAAAQFHPPAAAAVLVQPIGQQLVKVDAFQNGQSVFHLQTNTAAPQFHGAVVQKAVHRHPFAAQLVDGVPHRLFIQGFGGKIVFALYPVAVGKIPLQMQTQLLTGLAGDRPAAAQHQSDAALAAVVHHPLHQNAAKQLHKGGILAELGEKFG